jgi:hypothetical protein
MEHRLACTEVGSVLLRLLLKLGCVLLGCVLLGCVLLCSELLGCMLLGSELLGCMLLGSELLMGELLLGRLQRRRALEHYQYTEQHTVLLLGGKLLITGQPAKH